MEQDYFFKRDLKIDDEADNSQTNSITIIESSDPMYGSGSKVWDSSIFLAKALAYMNEQKTYVLKGKVIVELGCGVGLLSVYLAALGAQVYATDLPMVEPLVSKNIKNNAIVVHDRLNFLAYNWNDKWPLPDTKIDYIVASEPFANKELIPAFLNCVKEILELNKPKCKLFLAFRLKEDDLSSFAQVLQQKGLHQEKWPLEDMHPNYADPRTGIYSIRLL